MPLKPLNKTDQNGMLLVEILRILISGGLRPILSKADSLAKHLVTPERKWALRM